MRRPCGNRTLKEATGRIPKMALGRKVNDRRTGQVGVPWRSVELLPGARALASRCVIYARLRDWAAVEDVLQEVAVALAKDLGPRRGCPRCPRLRRVAIRQALLFRRQHDRQRRRETLAAQRQQDFAGNGKPTPADPLAWLLAQERARLVHAAVEQLPPVDAELLMLKHGRRLVSAEKLAERFGDFRLCRADPVTSGPESASGGDFENGGRAVVAG